MSLPNKLVPFYVCWGNKDSGIIYKIYSLALSAGAVRLDNPHETGAYWAYFGVNEDGETLYHDSESPFGSDALLLNIDDAIEWLEKLTSDKEENSLIAKINGGEYTLTVENADSLIGSMIIADKHRV